MSFFEQPLRAGRRRSLDSSTGQPNICCACMKCYVRANVHLACSRPCVRACVCVSVTGFDISDALLKHENIQSSLIHSHCSRHWHEKMHVLSKSDVAFHALCNARRSYVQGFHVIFSHKAVHRHLTCTSRSCPSATGQYFHQCERESSRRQAAHFVHQLTPWHKVLVDLP